MSTFNIQNISAINLQTGDNNNMSISEQSNMVQWDILTREFKELARSNNGSAEYRKLLEQSIQLSQKKDKIGLSEVLKKFTIDLFFDLSKTALIEIIKLFL